MPEYNLRHKSRQLKEAMVVPAANTRLQRTADAAR